jgi:hypothetical protein
LGREQVGVAAGGHDPAVDQVGHPVRAVEQQRRRADHDSRTAVVIGVFSSAAAVSGGGEAFGDDRLGVRVDRRGGFDEQQHLRVGQEGADEPEPLALPAGQ